MTNLFTEINEAADQEIQMRALMSEIFTLIGADRSEFVCEMDQLNEILTEARSTAPYRGDPMGNMTRRELRSNDMDWARQLRDEQANKKGGTFKSGGREAMQQGRPQQPQVQPKGGQRVLLPNGIGRIKGDPLGTEMMIVGPEGKMFATTDPSKAQPPKRVLIAPGRVVNGEQTWMVKA